LSTNDLRGQGIMPARIDCTSRRKVSGKAPAAGAFEATTAAKSTRDGTLTSAGVGLTVISSGKVGGGSVTDAEAVMIASEATSVGTALSKLLTPTRAAGGALLRTCNARAAAQRKVVPAECRHA
jgi:hypothetical protein